MEFGLGDLAGMQLPDPPAPSSVGCEIRAGFLEEGGVITPFVFFRVLRGGVGGAAISVVIEFHVL